MKIEWTEDVKIKCLLWCNRRCCLCGKHCGPDIEVAHITPRKNNIDNAIPLCYDWHAKVGHYNTEHPRGTKYKPKELKARRDQIYEEETRHLVPPIHFEITQDLPNEQKRQFPNVGFNIRHLGDSLPVKVLVTVQVVNGGNLKVLEREGHYSGKKPWNMNPRRAVLGGNFTVPERAARNTNRLELRVSVTIIDCHERKHHLLPVGWVYQKGKNSWYFEP